MLETVVKMAKTVLKMRESLPMNAANVNPLKLVSMQCSDLYISLHSPGSFTQLVIEPEGNVTILAGSSIMIVCSTNLTSSGNNAEGFCPTCLMWTHNHTTYSNRSETSVNWHAITNLLPLKPITLTNSGLYKCKANAKMSSTLHISVGGEYNHLYIIHTVTHIFLL